MKQTLIWFSLQRGGTRNGLPNIKETFSESLQLQMSVLHQRMSIFQASRLVSQFHMMAGQGNVSHPNQTVEASHSKLKFT